MITKQKFKSYLDHIFIPVLGTFRLQIHLKTGVEFTFSPNDSKLVNLCLHPR